MKPFIKWPGGKKEELKIIIPNMPLEFNRYIEPFVGGGAVYLDIEDAREYLINDKSEELICLYNNVKSQSKEFLEKLKGINNSWIGLETIVLEASEELIKNYIKYRCDEVTELMFHDYITQFMLKNKLKLERLLKGGLDVNLQIYTSEIEKNLKSKTKRMKKIEKEKGLLSNKDILDNYEAAFKSGFYMYFRYIYNNFNKYKIDKCFKSAVFYFIREYCYSSMFRYNKSGGFNVPYGGISYNRKNFKTKIDSLSNCSLVSHLKNTTIKNLDFEEFLDNIKPETKDFIFLDPPYDSKFSTYSENKFDEEDQVRLANYLKNTPAKFMLVIKNTELIYSLYKEFNIKSFDKKYLVSFQNRNEKDVKHLLITNY